MGEPLYAPCDSIVIEGADRPSGSVRGYSNWVWGRSLDGAYDWCLGHMPHGSIRVRKGDRIRAGQQVAAVGAEGESTGPHAHLSVYLGPLTDGRTIDPLGWLAEGVTTEGGTMVLGLDYAGGRPGGQAIKSAGYGFAVRYLSEGGASLPGKLLTPQEADDLRANGVDIAVVWESSADRMLAGSNAGIADAQSAVLQIKRCGGPTDRPVYFACDFDATPEQQAQIDDYLRGAASVIGLENTGIYGGYWPLKRARANGVARWFWQTGAWSGGNVLEGLHLYQRIGFVSVGGVQCDVNEARAEDYGQWSRAASGSAPTQPSVDQLILDQLVGPGFAGWPQLGGMSVVDFLARFRADFDEAMAAIMPTSRGGKA